MADVFSSAGSEEDLSDKETCSEPVLLNEFDERFSKISEVRIGSKKIFAMNLDADSEFSQLAVALSNGIVSLFKITDSGLIKDSRSSFLQTLIKKPICDVKFSKSDPNILFVAYAIGNISMIDTRTGKIEEIFQDDSDGILKPLTCLDINANGKVICAGTKKILDDAFLLFIDVRKKSLLGAYWESHFDDLTSVKFHQTNPNILTSGSTDGLINVFDISHATEDDALQQTINTESSIQMLNWHRCVSGKDDVISCITHTNDFSLYDIEGDSLGSFSRSTISSALKYNSSSADCYLVNCHQIADSSLSLIAGSHINRGEVLQTVKILEKTASSSAIFENNKQIVRDSVCNAKNDCFITVGESCMVSMWKPSPRHSLNAKNTNDLKAKSKLSEKLHKMKPY